MSISQNSLRPLNEANKYIFVKDYAKAESLIKEMIEHSEASANLLVHLRLVELMSMLGRLSELTTYYSKISLPISNSDLVKECARGLIKLYDQSSAPQMIEVKTDDADEGAKDPDLIETFHQLIQHPEATSEVKAGMYFAIGYCLEIQGNQDRAIFNYQESLRHDPKFHPSLFGLSQLHYNKGQDSLGDQFFFQFENEAPYNVYGNFETHRKLGKEFVERKEFDAAIKSIETLSNWWRENKGHCPKEIQIYEFLATAQIQKIKGDLTEATILVQQAKNTARELIGNVDQDDQILFFVAKVLDEFGEQDLAFDFYTEVLKSNAKHPGVIQKVGSHFLGSGQFESAKKIFRIAYEFHPNHPEIRFCLLVSELRLAKVDVEEYLMSRERMRELNENSSDRVELLALIHHLLAKFQKDPEVQFYAGELYSKLGSSERAQQHFDQMIDLDPIGKLSGLRYAHFQSKNGSKEKAFQAIERMTPFLGPEDVQLVPEMNWIKASYYADSGQPDKATALLEEALKNDPWNIASNALLVAVKTKLHTVKHEQLRLDPDVEGLGSVDEKQVNWSDFDRDTLIAESLHLFDLGYYRTKLKLLYTKGSEVATNQFVQRALKFNALLGIRELIRLINTNFDSPSVCWALGILCKETWQLETASMWFDLALSSTQLDGQMKSRIHLELADCLVLRNIQIPKAVEYAKLSHDSGFERASGRSALVLAHALLRSGQVRQAQAYLEATGKDEDFEKVYLKGLIFYRNGVTERAKETWKPLVKKPVDTLRLHHLKQEMLKYYYEGEPYEFTNVFKVN